MLANMASSLIKHKRITTTVAKAKALRSYVEPLITKSKTDETNSRRVVFSYLQDKEAVSELFREVSPKVADRPGGYLRIFKLPTRLGDSADMAIIELVDFNDLLVKEAKPKKSRRSRRGSGNKKAAETTVAPADEAEVEESKGEAGLEETSVAEDASKSKVTDVDSTTEEPSKKKEGGDKEEKKA